mmetsp:Transcript_20455/g.29591  ORF Transcript_20455/g.29591 Transcript_20455/m.29591 type:complete len:152 (-) Transcript_20455:416-871(-)
MYCHGSSIYNLPLSDGTTVRINVWFYPDVVETFISPQSLCQDDFHEYTTFNILCHHPMTPHIKLYSSSGLSSVTLNLTHINALYYFDANPSNHTQVANHLNTTLTSERWHQRLENLGMHQLQHLLQHSNEISNSYHPYVLHSCDICNQACH